MSGGYKEFEEGQYRAQCVFSISDRISLIES